MAQALQRSKSAPHGMPALLPAPASLVRASSFHTTQEAAKPVKKPPMAAVAERVAEERGDPFSLSGFFPSSLGDDKWGWLRDEEKEQEKQWSTEDGDGGSVLFGEEDSMTREAIRLEDKLGVLSLGGILQTLAGEMRAEYDGDGEREAVDEETLWAGLRARRARTLSTLPEFAGRDAEDWKTPVDSAIDEYFPIWDIAAGNSRETKVPHVAFDSMSVSQDNFFLDHHLSMQPGEHDQHDHNNPQSLPQSPVSPAVNLLVSNRQPSPSSNNPSATEQPIATADPNASIQSILAASKKEPPANGQPWAHPPALGQPHANENAVISQTAAGKRKLEEPGQEDPHTKIRRTVGDHVSHDPLRVMPMTTVICLHAAVAQKSYGTEKRFLCPPPVVHIEGPVWHLRSQQLSMAVVSENGERSFEQKAPLDNNMTASFKFLHVTGTAKAKSFQLSLDIADPPPPSVTSEGADATPGRVWAAFDSAPVTIISKPSKKTAKTRNISSCILAGGPVSLFNRINSQTVRTKYMTIDHAQLCASNVAWSAFNVNVVSRPTEAPPIGGPQPVTYGCEIVLSDTHSGISTSPLIIRKVDKGRVSADDGGPVSQMQKIALQRVNPDGSRHYLSAAGPLPGTPGIAAPPTAGISTQAGTHPLLFQSPRIRDEMKDGMHIISDEVDDYLCWTIVGISKFQYTFFDAFGQNNNIPEMPITPFPTLFTAPVYRPNNNTIELTVSNFFYEDPKTRQQTPLDVYLGNLGPLRHRVYQATPPGPLTNISPFVQTIPPEGLSDVAGTPPTLGAPRYMASGPMHTIVIVEMPPLADVIKALDQDALPPNADGSGSNPHSPRPDGTPAPDPRAGQPPIPLAGRSLPLLFIRASDGVGYHSGRTITCENVFQGIDLGSMAANPPAGANLDTGWLAAAQVAASADGGLHGWNLRVM